MHLNCSNESSKLTIFEFRYDSKLGHISKHCLLDEQSYRQNRRFHRRARSQTPVFDVRDLLGGGREAIIIHAGERYRLRVTANDKLILTK